MAQLLGIAGAAYDASLGGRHTERGQGPLAVRSILQVAYSSAASEAAAGGEGSTQNGLLYLQGTLRGVQLLGHLLQPAQQIFLVGAWCQGVGLCCAGGGSRRCRPSPPGQGPVPGMCRRTSTEWGDQSLIEMQPRTQHLALRVGCA